VSSDARASATVAVSGASGFLGAAICDHLAQRGAAIRALVRDPRAPSVARFARYRCDLPDAIDEAALERADVLVHCAWETRFRDPQRSRRANVDGSRRLFEVARRAGLRIVFVSSLSAHEDAVSPYGRTKLEVEAMLDLARDAIVRPGTIVGEGGVFWRQAGTIARLPFIPLFYGGDQLFQTVALFDLCEAIHRIATGAHTGLFRIAESSPVAVSDFYAAIAQHVGRRARFLRLPGDATLLALRAAERLGFQLPVSSDNLLGLKRLRAFDVEPDAQRLGLVPRSMRESFAGIRWETIARRPRASRGSAS